MVFEQNFDAAFRGCGVEGRQLPSGFLVWNELAIEFEFLSQAEWLSLR